MKDYAKVQNRNSWLRHPTLGDPSFDTFEKLGDTVHRSNPPWEWGVNGSLFRDPKTDNWYYYAGVYPYGYAVGPDLPPSTFIIYRSCDKGKSWACLGPGFQQDFYLTIDGQQALIKSHPDVVLQYDEECDRYWLAYDWGSSGNTWENAHSKNASDSDSGAGLAWAMSPEGPFHPLEIPFFSNKKQYGRLGVFSRGYASTVLKRKNDWIAFILCDADQHFCWGLACMTAPSPEGPWSDVHILLSDERAEYYPAPVEFYPCFTHDGIVYAPATSVSKNRNYQAVFRAVLEEAHRPEAWSLAWDGGFWHSRNLEDEKYGIWGQTINGFVENGQFYVMYPSKDSRDYGTLSVASRPWAQPFSDGFTFSGHAGKSISPLLAAYKDFTLNMEFTFTGTVGVAFDYHGILGSHAHSSDAVPHVSCFDGCYAIMLDESGTVRLERRGQSKEALLYKQERFVENVHAVHLLIENRDGMLKIQVNDKCFWSGPAEVSRACPLALIAHEFSILNCKKFQLTGPVFPYEFSYNAFEALLGAGQLMSNWQRPDNLKFAGTDGFVGEGGVSAKWNFIGSWVSLYAPKSPDLGEMDILIDGHFYTTICLTAEACIPSTPVYRVSGLFQGRHCLSIRPRTGKIALDIITFGGEISQE
ncbi:hypothetical protein [Hydrogeniiclostridium mannosilyticum]|uniref:hypothetical protein n=1 Tax=Hydrogeniiclostridium mannosilyticum TaxID=2764322 RepID=UPI00399A3EAF